MTLPDGIDPGVVPPLERLDALTEEEIYTVIRYHQTQNYVAVGAQFWIDELSRRRTQAVLDQIAQVAAQEVEHAAEMVRLTASAAAENAKTATLNQEMRDMTRTMMWMSGASFLVSLVAVVVSVVALAAGS